MNAEIVEIDGKQYIEIGTVVRSTRKRPRCPACGAKPHGTADVTHSVAYASIERNRVCYVGETESDEVWNNQTSLKLDGLPVLECGACYTWFVHRSVKE